MSTLEALGSVCISDIPKAEGVELKEIGVIGDPDPAVVDGGIALTEVNDTYLRLTVPIQFPADSPDRKVYKAAWLLHRSWFVPGFDQADITERVERIQYDINMSKLTRGLIDAAGVEEDNLFTALQEIVGRTVGFKTKKQKNDPTFTEVSYFFTPPTTTE